MTVSSEIRIVGGTVVTQDDQSRVVPDSEVAFDTATGTIRYVGAARGPAGANDVDARGHVVLPGLVNAHTHSGMTPLRGYSEDVDLAHSPVSNLKIGAGIAPVPRIRAAGIRTGLGTDSVASNNNLDLFEEVKVGVLVQRGLHESPYVVLGVDYLAMATSEGAQAVGFPEVGRLEAGRWADIALLDASGSPATPMHSATSYLTFAAGGSDVRHVFVGGRQVVADGVVTTLDEHEVRARERDGRAHRVR